MAKRLPSLRSRPDDAPEVTTGTVVGNLGRVWAWVLLWLVLWLPLSTIFPQLHAHVPIPPAVMPLFFLLYPTLGTGMGWEHWTAIYLPAGAFWVGLGLVLTARRLLFPPAKSPQGR
jgi:hypothetical protein